MRRDKAVTRILLILSVVHVAASAPAIIRQRSLEVTKDVTPALENRANSDDESSHAFPQMDNTLPTTSGTVPSHDDTPPAPSDPQLHSDPSPELGTPQLNVDQPPTSGTPQLHDDLPPTPGAPPSQEDPLPASGTSQLHNGEPPTPGAPTLQGDMSSASEDPQVQDDPSPWQQHNILRPPGEMLQGESSKVPQLDDDPWCPVHHPDCQWRPSPWQQQHANLRPPGEMLQGASSVFPQLDDDPWSDMHHADWRSPWEILRGEVSTAPSVSSDQWNAEQDVGVMDEMVDLGFGGLEAPLEAPELQNDPPSAPGSPQVHDDPPPALGSPQVHDEWAYPDSEAPSSPHTDSEAPMPVDSEAPLLHSETPQPLESEAPPSAPETHTIFNDALKQKLKVSAGVGAVAGVFVGLAFGVDKLIKDHSHKSQPAGRGLASGSVVIRGESMYPLPPKRPVSRANANLLYDDLRLLSILTRRALERLD